MLLHKISVTSIICFLIISKIFFISEFHQKSHLSYLKTLPYLQWIKILIRNIIWLSLVLFTMQRLHRMADEDWLTSTNKNNNKWIQLGCKHITIHKYMYNHTISAKVIHLPWLRIFYPFVCTECTNQAWAMALNLYKNIFLQSKKKIFSQPTYLYMLVKSKRVCNEIVVSLKII